MHTKVHYSKYNDFDVFQTPCNPLQNIILLICS